MALQVLSETPLKALVLPYYAAAAAIEGCSRWKLAAAVLTAALGLWSVRFAAVASKSNTTLRPDDRRAVPPRYGGSCPDPPQSESARQEPAPESGARASPAPAGRSTLCPVIDGNEVWSTRKSTVFRLRGRHVDEEDASVEQAEVPEQEEKNPWDGNRGHVSGGYVVACPGEGRPGWYRHQDMAALNGRVVRLWEEERRTCGSPLRGRRPPVVWLGCDEDGDGI